MIDWLTLRFDASLLPKNTREMFLQMTGRILKIDANGNLEWESCCRENIRSDSHQVICKFGSFLEIQGSPARVVSSNNVFGSLDIIHCAKSMIVFVARHYGVIIPSDLHRWSCTRIDVTRNYDMGSLEQCVSAVNAMKHVVVGRQKPRSDMYGCGWGYGSSLHMGKAYCKGPHMRKLVKKEQAFLEPKQLRQSDNLLRLEYSIRRHLMKRFSEQGISWFDFTPEFLIKLHDDYFSKFISEVDTVDMDNVLDNLLNNVGSGEGQILTQGQARAAYDCYTRIKIMGFDVARSTFSKPSWYRHKKNLESIGIGEVDMQQMNVVPLKRKQIELGNPVSCWDDIKIA